MAIKRVVFGAIFIMLCGLATTAVWDGGSKAQAALRWKMATLAPKQLGWAQQVRTIVLPYFRDATDDTVRWKIYYGGVMGNDDEYLKKMRIGQLQGAGLSSSGTNQACPEMTVLGLPFLLNNYEEVDYLRHVMFDTFDYYFKQNGYKMFLWIDQDFDQTYSSKYAMNKLEDFKRSKFQTWYGPLEEAVLAELGASPIPLPPTEAPTGYRTGVIDANFGPAIYQVGSQMYTSCKYISPTNFRYGPATITLTNAAWDQLGEDRADRLNKGREQVTARFVKGSRKDNERCVEGMIKYGLTLVELTPEQKAAIANKTMVVYETMADKLFPRDLLQETQRHLADFRRTQMAKTRLKRPAPDPALVAKAKEEQKRQEAALAAKKAEEAARAAEKKAREEAALAAKKAEEAAKNAEMKAEEEAKIAAKKAEEEAQAAREKARQEAELAAKKAEEAKLAARKAEEAARAKQISEAAEREADAIQAKVEREEKEEADRTADMLAQYKTAYKESIEAEKKAEAKKKLEPATPAADQAPRVAAWQRRRILVRKVQQELQDKGYYKSTVDGIFGPVTYRSVMNYQRDAGLPQTGSIDQKLLNSLGVKLTVTRVQEILQHKGYYKMRVDGIPGPGTRAAVRQYQQANGLPATGVIDTALLEHMGIEK